MNFAKSAVYSRVCSYKALFVAFSFCIFGGEGAGDHFSDIRPGYPSHYVVHLIFSWKTYT